MVFNFITLPSDGQVKIVDFDYGIDDRYGNEQTRREHSEPGKQVGSWMVKLTDPTLQARQSVDYEAGAYGNLAHVVIHQQSHTEPAYPASAPAYPAPHSAYKRSVSYGAPSYSQPMSYAAPKMHYGSASYAAPAKSYSAPSYGHSVYKRSVSYGAPSYSQPMSYAAPKMHYVTSSYGAPSTTYATY